LLLQTYIVDDENGWINIRIYFVFATIRQRSNTDRRRLIPQFEAKQYLSFQSNYDENNHLIVVIHVFARSANAVTCFKRQLARFWAESWQKKTTSIFCDLAESIQQHNFLSM
jgi:hypothetical protein